MIKATTIKDALASNALYLVTQPIVDIQGRQVMGNEYLVRMRTGGQRVAAGAFIPVAERSGMIEEVDRWVLQQVISGYIGTPHTSVRRFVNISPMTLESHQIVQFLADIISSSAADPSLIVFEVTETAAIKNPHRAARHLHQLRALGCSVALDDFGCGYSSLEQIKTMPADFIKIGGVFMQDLRGRDGKLVEALCSIAQSYEKRIVAEFVADEQMRCRLQQLGVDYIQGDHANKMARQIARQASLALQVG